MWQVYSAQFLSSLNIAVSHPPSSATWSSSYHSTLFPIPNYNPPVQEFHHWLIEYRAFHAYTPTVRTHLQTTVIPNGRSGIISPQSYEP